MRKVEWIGRMESDMPTDSQTIELPAPTDSDPRRQDIDAKQQRIAELLHDSGCEGLLVLHPANFRWLTSGADPVGLFGRDELPGLFFNSHQRWLLSSSIDSARFFAENLDGLGFQVKEWHWSTSREQMLADLVFGRKIISDQSFRDCKPSGTFFTNERRKLSAFEIERMAELGKFVVHALEATARNFAWGDPEDEIAGQLAHRLYRHGVEPMALQIMGDGRARNMPRRGFRSNPVERSCVMQVTGRKFGLHATAARTVFREVPDEVERTEFEAAVRFRLTHLSGMIVGERVARTTDAGNVLLKQSAFEHEWWTSAPVALTGREPSEGLFLPTAQDRWTNGWAVLWKERVGTVSLVDTYGITEDSWSAMTPPLEWPIRRGVVQGRTFDVADLLVRKD